MKLRVLLARIGVALGAWVASSCAPAGFPDEAIIQSVRILASSADTPYAQPGAEVNVHVLAVDGRDAGAAPMSIYWLPFWCKNPPNDAYYACFQGIAQGAGFDGGTDGGLASLLKPGINLTPFLPDAGPSYTFQMPSDAVTAHRPVPGTAPYGLAIVFNAACAGHLELLPLDPSNDNPQQVPIGCFDADHNQLGPDDWVLGFTRVYAYAADAGPDGGPLTNANPVIASIDVNGQTLAVTPTAGAPQVYTTLPFTSARCTADTRDDCAHVPIGPVVTPDSWEVNPLQTDVNGNPSHEELWANFYTTFGSVTDDARLLYDPTSGSIGDPSVTDNKWLPPNDPGDGLIWIVVHDNRGGASWVTIPVHVQ
jgi:hypothetical protein